MKCTAMPQFVEEIACKISADGRYCPKCTVLQNAEHFPFGLESTYELYKINMSNSMKLVEMIPEFEINSQILRVDDLCSKDIDENLVNKINCKYFTNDEFSKLSMT